MANITKVPNGPLIKKTGKFKGSTLKNGGPIKKETNTVVKDNTSTAPKRNVSKDIRSERTTVANKNKAITNSYISKSKEYKKDSDRDKDTSARLKLQNMMGESSVGISPERALEVSKFGDKQAKTKDSLSTVYSKKAKVSVKNPKYKPALKTGGMIKRADGSMSKPGLWDNIRKNKGSGKKPTKQMLVQEKKIKAKSKK